MELRNKIQEALDNSLADEDLKERILWIVADPIVRVKRSELEVIAHALMERPDEHVKDILGMFLSKHLDNFEYQVLK